VLDRSTGEIELLSSADYFGRLVADDRRSVQVYQDCKDEQGLEVDGQEELLHCVVANEISLCLRCQ